MHVRRGTAPAVACSLSTSVVLTDLLPAGKVEQSNRGESAYRSIPRGVPPSAPM